MKENIITYIPLKIYRYLRWQAGAQKEYQYNRNHFSKKYADICFNAHNASRQSLPIDKTLAAYQKKDAFILDYLQNLCPDVIQSHTSRTYCSSTKGSSRKIWVFWWTGESTAPDIVKACIKSIRKNANGYEVVMLDQSNYYEFVTLPDDILKKHQLGIIGHAHFSDIIRMSLLTRYGGMWIDATVFLSQPIPKSIMESQFYTLKTYDPQATYASKSRWCGYFLAGDAGFPLFSFTRDMLIAHWQRTDHIIDYLLMDYVFELAYRHLDEVRNAIDNLADNNTNRGKLMGAINEPYSPELFHELETQDTFASKLSWRYGNPCPQTKDGQLSNYGYLLTQ